MASTIVHFEVPAGDTRRALKFYGEMFGSSFHALEAPVEYHLAELSDGLAGAIHRVDEGGGIPGVFVYFEVDDINEAVERARRLGGAGEPSPIPARGWYARCVDTEGNQFGLWQNDPKAAITDDTPEA